jgi:predicted nucleic-acid-binding protein
MIAVDTNVLVRFLVEDDPTQSAAARHLLTAARARGEEVFLGDVVLCETAWVLQGAYRLSRPAVAAALSRLTRARGVVVEEEADLAPALAALAQGSDLADSLILARALRRGAVRLYTFDRHLARSPQVELAGEAGGG